MLTKQSKAAIYLRLSRDDGGDAESNSIGNQRDMLRKYAKEQGFLVFDEYVDDGISGTTFERAEFQRMIGDVEDNKIGTIICKDLSRLGRNNAMVAYYTEIFFPENQVRFIAVNDCIDSAKGDNEIMGFRSVINEFYARDISKKIRSSFRTLAEKGKFVGSHPPFGYMRDPNDRHRLVIDPETAPVIKEIFAMAAEGNTPHRIKTLLTKKKVLPPRAYYARNAESNAEDDMVWSMTTVSNILRNKAYCGHIVSQRETTQSFKNRKIVYRPESEWVVCENMHEPLVDELTFEKVQKLIKVKKRANKSTIENIFVGMIKCPTCGYNLCYQGPHQRKTTGAYVCNNYKHRTKNCTSHYITYRVLHEIVLGKFQKLAAFVEEHRGDLETFYTRYLLDSADLNRDSQKQALEKHRKRIRELDAIIKKIVEQNALGALTDERFMVLSADYESEYRELKGKVVGLEAQLNQKRDSLQNAGHFLEAIGKYAEISKLTVSIVHELIEKVEVHQAEGKGKSRTQRVDIYWRFIGFLPDN